VEELTTFLCQIEVCVNSRPITPLNSDPSEPEALTLVHFLIGGDGSLLFLPEHNIIYSGPMMYLLKTGKGRDGSTLFLKSLACSDIGPWRAFEIK